MFQSLFEENKEYFSIKFENPLLNYLGLTSATTGQLYAWWYQTNYRGEYVNQQTFLIPNSNFDPFEDPSDKNPTYVTPSLAEFLSIANPAENDQNNYTFKGWRKQGYNGKDFYYYGPSLSTGTNRYLKWSLFEGGSTGSINITDPYCSSSSYNPLAGATIKYKYEDLHWDSNSAVDCLGSQSQVDYPDCSGLLPQWFYRLINSYSSVINEGWGGLGGDPKNWPLCLQARKALADDIMSGGGLVWSGVLGFNVNIGPVQCLKFEPVKYTLQFFQPDDLRKKNDNFIAMKKIFLSGPAEDQVGRKIANSSNGDYTTVVNEDDTSQHKVGELSVTWNPVDRKYESGTLQMPAVLATDIAASNDRNADFLDAASIEDLLNDPNSENYINMPTGLAIPLMNGNGNPSVITPTYDQEQPCRTNNEKFKIIVYNPFPRTYKKDSTVMLSKINGVWIPLDAGQETKEETNEVLGKWDFAYFMTNAEYYFTNRTPTDGEYKRFSYDTYESDFRKSYYLTNFSNSQQILNLNTPNANPESVKTDANRLGYIHITSWDFMGYQMGGTRWMNEASGGNAIAGTVVGYDLNDNIINSDVQNPQLTNPFFGCVFPDGYDVDQVKEKFERYSNNNIPVDKVGGPFMLNDIEDTKNIFNDSYNVNIESSMRGISGVFAGLKNGSYTLRHLPADIACNSSRCTPFSLQNGSPLRNFYTIAKYLTVSKNPFDNNNLSLIDSESLFSEGDFLAYFIEAKNNQDDPDEPVWNLKPVKPNRIQFRPMKIELYASAEWRIFTDQTDYQRRLLLNYPDIVPPQKFCCDENGQPSNYIGFTCEDGCPEKLGGDHCGSKDPRLAILPPDIYNKILPKSYLTWNGFNNTRGKFGMRAAMMVKDFFDDEQAKKISRRPLVGGWDVIASPLWGFGAFLERRNLFLTHDDNKYWYTIRAGMAYNNYNRNGTEEIEKNDTERLLNGSPQGGNESTFTLFPNKFGGYSEHQLCLNAGSCPQKYDFPCGIGTDTKTLSEISLGLAYGQRDYFWKGKNFKLWHTRIEDPSWPRTESAINGIASLNFNMENSVAGYGAFGVIGATCVIKAASQKGITFTSDYYYGLRKAAGSSNSSFKDEAGINGILNSNTTGLYARIFQFWPRHLTIYDPRFFAVHHFNEGVGKLNNPIQTAYFIDGSYVENPTPGQIEQAEKQNYPIDFTASLSASPVDLATPTLYDGITILNSTVLYDAVGNDKTKKLREKQHWKILEHTDLTIDGRNRRGKLLPYTYKKYTIRACQSDDNQVIFWSIDPNKKVEDLNLPIYGANILFINGGQNYRVGDRLTVTAGVNFEISVLTVAEQDDPITGVKKGAILTAKVVNAGEDFNPSDFMKIETVLDIKAKSAARVVNLEVKSGGSGFVGYLINGAIAEMISTDEKPEEISGLVKLTPPNDGQKGPAEGSFSVTVTIPKEKKHSSDLYDVFLHFHNDASHTFGFGYGSTIVQRDPYINLEIT